MIYGYVRVSSRDQNEDRQIPYKYECPIVLSNGKKRYPDVKIDDYSFCYRFGLYYNRKYRSCCK